MQRGSEAMSLLFQLLRAIPNHRFSTASSVENLVASLTVTQRAITRLSELQAKARSEGRVDADSLRLRVRVDGGGCSGFKYEFNVESSGLQEGDKCFGERGCFAVVDPVSLELLGGATVDWEESLMRSAFVIASNPNAESSCGCKSSFSLKPPIA